MAVRSSSHRFTRAAAFTARSRKPANRRQQNAVGDVGPVLSASWRRVLGHIESTVKAFARCKGGTVHISGPEINIRIRSGGGFATVQVLLCGGADHPRLEVIGIRRDGWETTRTVFELKQPDGELDLGALGSALEQARG